MGNSSDAPKDEPLSTVDARRTVGATSLGHLPENKWTFDESVARCFDDMLERSIPQYHIMRATTTDVARCYVRPDTWIVDLGCARGGAVAPLVTEFGETNRFLGVERSQSMLRAARQRFARELATGCVAIERMDLRISYPDVEASVTLSVLTLQFTPIELRQRIVSDIFAHTLPGGAFILVEKMLGESAEIDTLMVENHHRLKKANGYSQKEIDHKRRSLEGVLAPLTARWNENLLRTAGFRHVDCFWRWMNFAAWVAVTAPY